MTEVRENIWVNKPEADELIKQVLTPAIRYTREQVLGDMPKEDTVSLPVPMDAKAEKVFKTLQRDMLLQLELETDVEVRAPNAGVLVNKLLQISSGSLITDDNYVTFDISHKIENIERIMSEGDGKTIIVCPFTKTIKRIEEELIERGHKVAVTTGSTSAVKRGSIFTEFQNDPDSYEILIAHPIVIQYGVELGAASNLVFWSVPMVRAGSYKQVKDRLYSSKQKSKNPTCFLMHSSGLEKRMFDNLENRVEWETSLSDYFKVLR